ncbi:hypothetical protein ACFFUT_06145 [Pseudohalocynthiibacter aestuariivivens]|uniref:Uncharacterized protein n=2 Tax=Pseudohalocynthiibacter TaxID=1759417 RepID=A0ABV5JD25_9RHOB|nr:hypothetical protein [Pseudohalocynthiibacter aestuariivivens]MBS9717144.1 hypothetical protein [Pseudohalocynthiibacter aestuariivivens]
MKTAGRYILFWVWLFTLAFVPLSLSGVASAEEQTITFQNACEGTEFKPPLEIVHWMENDNFFNINYTEFGWLDWVPKLEEDLGLRRTAGPRLSGAVPVLGFHDILYDQLAWIEADINADEIPDRVVVTTFLQGASYNHHTLYAFCGEPTRDESNGAFSFCGAISYGLEASVPSQAPNSDGSVSTRRNEAVARHSSRVFVLLRPVDGKSAIAVVSSVKDETGHRTYFGDVWRFYETGFAYSRLCK